MKIQNDPLRALLEQSEAHRKPKAGGADFESLLAGQLEGGPAVAGGAVSAERNVAALAMQIRSVQELGGAEAQGRSDAIYMEGLDNLLNKWDLYGQALARPESASLKDVNGLLDGMSGELAALKAALPELEGDNAGLAGLVNELEVLATTERIKFNRGDYL